VHEAQRQQLLATADIAGVHTDGPVWEVERDIIANGIRLHVLDWGPQDAPGLLLLHGGCLTAHTWDLVCLSLSSTFRCLAIDMRGHGDSEWPSDIDYRLDSFAADVLDVLATEFLAPPVLVGMSLGGLTAMKVAGTRHVRLSGLVLVDVGPEPRVEGVQEILDFTGSNYELGSVDEFVERAVLFNSRRKPEMLRRSLLHNLRELPNGRWRWKWDWRRMEGERMKELEADQEGLWESVQRVEVPTLIVRGSDSKVFLDQDARKLANSIKESSIAIVSRAGHTVQGDNPAGLLDALRPFLSRVFTGN
jgi:esterase